MKSTNASIYVSDLQHKDQDDEEEDVQETIVGKQPRDWTLQVL